VLKIGEDLSVQRAALQILIDDVCVDNIMNFYQLLHPKTENFAMNTRHGSLRSGVALKFLSLIKT